MRDRWFFAFFLVSGFCALLCQVVWLRLAMAWFGVTTAMVSIVVSVVMTGLALGSAGGGRLSRRLRGPAPGALRAYAACEVVIALSALVVPAGLVLGRRLLAGSAWGSAGYHAASGAWVTLVLLPFCCAMGATLPLAMAALGPRVRGGRSTFGHLYAANVLGAAAGTLASAAVLIELVGLQATLEVGAALNPALAAAALLLSLRPAAGEAAPAPTVAPAPGGSSRLVLAALFATGFVTMAMEIIWVRQFAPLLGNVVYAFAIILSVYLVATLAGSLSYRSRRRPPDSSPSAAVWAAVALTALLPAVATDPRLYPATLGLAAPLGVVGRVAVALAPFSALLGFVTPWLVDRWSGGDSNRAGLAYAVNALGCLLGPLASGFLLVPALGERWALLLLALVPLAVAAAEAPWTTRARLAAAGLAALVGIAATRGQEARFPGARVRRDATATVLAVGEGMGQVLLVNGVGMTTLTPITKFMAHLPLAFLDHTPRRGLVICLGMGTSFRSMASWGIDTTAVELVPSVPAFLPDFHPDAPALLASGRARIVVDDGRRFLDRSGEAYDAVVVDPPPPVEAAGSSLLYSREFYRAVRARLAPGGILQAWSPGAEPAVTAAFLLAVHEEFPRVRVFGSVEGWGTHILASERPIADRAAADLAARLPPAAARDLVEWGPHPTPAEQLAVVLGRESPPDWARLARLARPLTDDHPLNEYYLLRRARARR